MAELIILDGIPLRGDELPSPGEALAVLKTSYRSLGRLANSGVLPCLLTAGGHRRYLASDVLAVRSERRRRTRRAVRGGRGEDEAVAS
jgi:hypothetical protein